MTSIKRYESGETPERPDQRRTRETRAERANRKRRHELLVEQNMWHMANSCAKKRRYATYDQARATLRFCEESEERPLYIYKCEYCGGWHLTHQASQQKYDRKVRRETEERIAREVAEKTAGPAARFGVGDLVIDEATNTPCVVNAVGEICGEPAYELSSADECSELGWVRESEVREA
ncbi:MULTISPECIES: hypothetical protein [unclassified Collinsella]|uniref:hypothetical protein n=1 Tax=unclassified Collinsella TaxID=2637548 RepID=UPI00319DE09C